MQQVGGKKGRIQKASLHAPRGDVNGTRLTCLAGEKKKKKKLR